MGSTTHSTLKTAFLKTDFTAGRVGRASIARPGERVRRLWLPEYSSWVSQLSCPLSDLTKRCLGSYPGHYIPSEGGWLLYWPRSFGAGSDSVPDFQGLHCHPWDQTEIGFCYLGGQNICEWMNERISVNLAALTLSSLALATTQEYPHLLSGSATLPLFLWDHLVYLFVYGLLVKTTPEEKGPRS